MKIYKFCLLLMSINLTCSDTGNKKEPFLEKNPSQHTTKLTTMPNTHDKNNSDRNYSSEDVMDETTCPYDKNNCCTWLYRYYYASDNK